MDVPATDRNVVVRPQTDSDVELRGRKLGDFVLRECIGEGAFAAVYRCDQPLLGREAVIKVLHQRLRASEVVLQRFMREARLASRLDHPYAAHVYAFGVEPDDGLAWIAMELVHGTSLERWLHERGPLPVDILVPFFEHVAEVVQNAHDHGIVHRDLKPSNVMMLEYAGRVFPKLLDFGIAKLIDEAAQLEQPGVPVEPSYDAEDIALQPPPDNSNQHLTQANATLGSPPYMSPEQWSDPLSVGPRSDLYSLAVMAYEALTGEQPFTGPTIAAIGEQHCNAEVPSVGKKYPASFDAVFRRALAKDPRDRQISALAFARELRLAAFPPGPDQSGAQPAVAAVPQPAKRRIWPLAAGAATLVVGGAALYALVGPPRSEGSRSRPVAASITEAHAPASAAPSGGPSGTASGTSGTASGTASTASGNASSGTASGAAASGAAASGAAASAPVASGGAGGAGGAGTAAVAPKTVLVQIESNPRGADVFRLPSETKVGSTPWKAELASEDGVQMFLIRKHGFADRRIEVDLRTGGTQMVTMARVVRRATPAPAAAPTPAPARRRGEPLDPFRTGAP